MRDLKLAKSKIQLASLLMALADKKLAPNARMVLGKMHAKKQEVLQYRQEHAKPKNTPRKAH